MIKNVLTGLKSVANPIANSLATMASTKAIKKRFFRWIFEQWQGRMIPIVHKPNVYGSSAREMGIYPTKNDMKIECSFPIKNEVSGNDSVLLHVCNDEGSWMIIKFMKINKEVAKIDFQWYDKVRFLQICHQF